MDIKLLTVTVLLAVLVSLSSEVSMKDISEIIHNSEASEAKWEMLLRLRNEMDGKQYRRFMNAIGPNEAKLFFEHVPDDEKVHFLEQMPRSALLFNLVTSLLNDGIVTSDQVEEALGNIGKPWLVKKTMSQMAEEQQVQLLEGLGTSLTKRFIRSSPPGLVASLLSQVSSTKSAKLFKSTKFKNREKVLGQMPDEALGNMLEHMGNKWIKKTTRRMTDEQLSNSLAYVAADMLSTIFGNLKKNRQLGVVDGMSSEVRTTLFEGLDPALSTVIIESLDAATAGEIISGLSEEMQKAITQSISEDKLPGIIAAVEESSLARSSNLEAATIDLQADQVNSLVADSVEEMEALDYLAEAEGGLTPGNEAKIDLLASDAHDQIDNLAEEIASIDTEQPVDGETMKKMTFYHTDLVCSLETFLCVKEATLL